MEFLDLNLSEALSSDSVNNLSDISLSPESVNNELQFGGSLFSSIFGDSKLTKAVLEAARLKKNDVVEFLVDKELFTSFGSQDEKGNTLLHYLVCSPNPNMKLIDKIVKKPNSKNFINKQNKNGDTPLILAVKSGHHDICSQLIDTGADKTIKNKEGLHVDTETEMVSSNKQKQVTAKSFEQISPAFNIAATGDEARKILEPIFNLLKHKHSPHLTSEPETIELTDTKTIPINHLPTQEQDTDDFALRLEKELNSRNSGQDELDNIFEKPPQNVQAGGDCGCNTDNLINAIEKYFDNNQAGGARKKKSTSAKTSAKTGKRRIRNVDSAIESEAVKPSNRESELSRAINNQTEEIINRTIKAIQTIITDNKAAFKGLKPDEQTARAIKAILWRMAKEKNPDMKSSLDVAIEMEKLVTKENIKEIGSKQVKDMIETLQKHYEEKKQKQAQQQDTISATSSDPVPSESAISATSY
ncbi:ankyrin repeat domain-containing protein [Fadolivirus algeromassiliense]|jgi:hypothetical protein|uniref:Ankyrin repeat domain-containing protein n=1 Tax=Fadolivirus FV1/VV64 TaxID=3070911 RepID=A0A7D3V8T6_9VIRU|nr:ankyrin repeat domain-containing protein [Fadolivirus algeromassiliense]QKF94017.1 ankyrin repeat domain-containing protein [Fadolivirus FV1/VV64]